MSDLILKLAPALTEAAATILIALIGTLGAIITTKLATKTKMTNLSMALDQLKDAAKITVGELQQTVVTALKESSADGKLTGGQVALLRQDLITKTLEKLMVPTLKLLNGAATDIEAIITGVAEDYINNLKHNVFPDVIIEDL